MSVRGKGVAEREEIARGEGVRAFFIKMWMLESAISTLNQSICRHLNIMSHAYFLKLIPLLYFVEFLENKTNRPHKSCRKHHPKYLNE